MKPASLATLLAIVLMGIYGPAAAHGDEDHGQDKPPATARAKPGAGPIAATPASGPGNFDSAQRLADGSLFVPKAVQHQLGLRTELAEVREVPATVEFNGKIIADPNAGGRVQAGQSGRIEAGPHGLPTLGQTVKKGEVLAYLRPVASSIERGNSEAQLADIESQLAIAERKATRYAQLDGALPQSSIDAAHLEWKALKKRRAAVGASINAPQALVAPASGLISAANAVVGQVVETKEILFEVVDPARLAVEALAYDPALVTDIASASAAVPGGALELQFVGGGRQLREQAIPLLFRVKSADVALAVGQPLKVIAHTSRTSKGTAVPQAALVKTGAGELAVWIHADAERFVLRKVGSRAVDANTVVLTSGVADGERVVTQGAGLLAQVR
jgi:hypothetical protein